MGVLAEREVRADCRPRGSYCRLSNNNPAKHQPMFETDGDMYQYVYFVWGYRMSWQSSGFVLLPDLFSALVDIGTSSMGVTTDKQHTCVHI